MTKEELIKQITDWKVKVAAAFDAVASQVSKLRSDTDTLLQTLLNQLSATKTAISSNTTSVLDQVVVQKNQALSALDTILAAAAVADPIPIPATPTFRPGTIVPLYTYPTNVSWTNIVAAAKAYPLVPVIAVVNPASGPGASQNSDYANNIPKLKAAGIRVLGYVRTNYANKDGLAPIATIQAQIDQWKAWYPVDGIFFDEMSAVAGQEAFYKQITTYAKSKGFTYTVGNPGGNSLPSYIGTVDTILIRENVGLSALPTWISGYPPSNFGMLGYGVANLDINYVNANKKTCGFFYITPDSLPNPWDSLAPYFSNLLATLNS